MPVRKRTLGLDDSYYVSGTAVRRKAEPRWEEPATRRVSSNREELLSSRVEQSYRRRTPARGAGPQRDLRSQQERRRADPTRAHYAPEPETHHLTHEEVNRRTYEQHARRREEEARRRRALAAQERADAEKEAVRRRQHRVQMMFAILGIFVVVLIAGGIFSLLMRYIQIEQMIVTQRKLTAEIEDQQKRLEELHVEINMRGNISQIQDYARENLNMDYAQKDKTRVIALP